MTKPVNSEILSFETIGSKRGRSSLESKRTGNGIGILCLLDIAGKRSIQRANAVPFVKHPREKKKTFIFKIKRKKSLILAGFSIQSSP